MTGHTRQTATIATADMVTRWEDDPTSSIYPCPCGAAVHYPTTALYLERWSTPTGSAVVMVNTPHRPGVYVLIHECALDAPNPPRFGPDPALDAAQTGATT